MKSERKSKWKLLFRPPGTCYLKVWVVAMFQGETPEADPAAPPETPPPTPPDPIQLSLTPVEWRGSGAICLKDPTKSTADIVQLEFSPSEYSVDVPASNGSVTVSIQKFSYVDGYEPDVSDPENPQPNGWPDPAWEPAAP